MAYGQKSTYQSGNAVNKTSRWLKRLKEKGTSTTSHTVFLSPLGPERDIYGYMGFTAQTMLPRRGNKKHIFK